MSHETSPALAQTRIQLINVKIAEFSSEETLCFSATVVFDGRRIAQASNEGHGGMTNIHPLKGADAWLREAIEYAESLPPEEDQYESGGEIHKYTIEMSLDYVVECLANDIADERRLRRIFNRELKKVPFIVNEQLVFLKGANLPANVDAKAALFSRLRAKHGQSLVILAELPRDEAFALWKQHRVRE